VSPGFKFKDADLLGMPIQVIVGDRNLKQGKVELKFRKTGERRVLPISDVLNEVESLLES
jgi:prolyl-tRNA synthetase